MKIKKLLYLILFLSAGVFSQKFTYTPYSEFLNKYVSLTGNVNYDEIYLNKVELDQIIKNFEDNTPNEKATKNEKMVYWINSYNVHMIKLVIENYPLTTMNAIVEPWKVNFVNYKGIVISLDYIENEILRKMNDPRVLFALNSASISSAILKNEAYEVAILDKQLNSNCLFFINDPTKNSITPEKAVLSKIFLWYAIDFANSTNMIKFINQFSLVKISEATQITYNEFNFDLNK